MTKEQVLEKLKFDTELRGLSKNTQDEYYTKAKIFQDHFNMPASFHGLNDTTNFIYGQQGHFCRRGCPQGGTIHNLSLIKKWTV